MSISLSSAAAFVAACDRAQAISLSAYVLQTEGPVRGALVAAARRGAHVSVLLQRDPYGDAGARQGAENRETVRVLRAAGADARLTDPAGPAWHMKAAVVDGEAWLDDRNWAADGKETILRDSDPDDVAVVTRTLAGTPSRDGHLRTTKHDAIGLEATLIRAAGTKPVAVESESFGTGAIYNALLARARAHLPTRLLVSSLELGGSGGSKEARRLQRLQSASVAVRVVDNDEKIALTGDAAWVGSGNATYAGGANGDQIDWGMAVRRRALVDGVRANFERNWDAARPFAGQPP